MITQINAGNSTSANGPAGGNGGSVNFYPGRGGVNPENGKRGLHGDITFYTAENDEMLRIGSDGKFFVEGRLVQVDIEVYHAFRAWLMKAGCRFGKGEDGGNDATFTPNADEPIEVVKPA